MKTHGRLAYEAFAKTLAQYGAPPMSAWDELDARYRGAWEAAARAALNRQGCNPCP